MLAEKMHWVNHRSMKPQTFSGQNVFCFIRSDLVTQFETSFEQRIFANSEGAKEVRKSMKNNNASINMH